MKKYTLGFAFNEEGNKVVLIEKTKPDFLKGKWNGVGGKVEKIDIAPIDGMIREFWEETGVNILDWRNAFFIDNQENNYQMWVYYTFSDKVYECKTMTEERVQLIDVKHLDMLNLSLNVQWFIQFALSSSNTFKLPINIIDEGGD